MSDKALALALAAPTAMAAQEREKLLAMPEADIRAGILAGDPRAFQALRAQIDDFVDNDPFLSDISHQLKRGDGPGCLQMHGSASWAPVRAEGDWSAWGAWEAWEECSIERVNNGTAVGPVPTGGWIVWHAPSGQQFGFPRAATNGRKKAEMMAVVQNGGKPTRVVTASGDAVASSLEFAEVAAQVGAEIGRLKAESQ